MRGLILLIVVGVLVYVAATVQIGDRTLADHVHNIWVSDEAQELVEGVKDESGPMLDRIKRGVQAGVEEARREPPDASVGARRGDERPSETAAEAENSAQMNHANRDGIDAGAIVE